MAVGLLTTKASDEQAPVIDCIEQTIQDKLDTLNGPSD